jgi:hypothetical protein
MDPFDHAEDEIQRAYAEGKISNSEMREQMKQVQRERRAALQERAQATYDDVMDDFYL